VYRSAAYATASSSRSAMSAMPNLFWPEEMPPAAW
jgi:hypothetical protein